MNQYDPQQMKEINAVSRESSILVCTEGRLIVEFTVDDLMRIKSWNFSTRQHQELIPRSLIALQAQQDPGLLEQMSKNITRQGLTNSTLNYLRVRHPSLSLLGSFLMPDSSTFYTVVCYSGANARANVASQSLLP